MPKMQAEFRSFSGWQCFATRRNEGTEWIFWKPAGATRPKIVFEVYQERRRLQAGDREVRELEPRGRPWVPEKFMAARLK